MATALKKTSRKKKARKVRKSSPARSSKKTASKKRTAKSKRVARKAGKTKKAAGKTARKTAAKKVARQPAKKSPKKSVKKAASKKPVEPTTKAIVPVAKPLAAPKSPKVVKRRAKATAAVAPSVAPARDTYFVTTPIFYPNGVPHIGHAYTAMVPDPTPRFQRLDGFDVRFLTGTDEHGLKMQQTAVAEGLTPLALADRNSARFRDMMTALNISYDDYIRTTEPRHARACQALWRAIENNGDIYLGKYAGWYSVRQEAYFDEAETTVGVDGIRREPLGSPVEWTEEET